MSDFTIRRDLSALSLGARSCQAIQVQRYDSRQRIALEVLAPYYYYSCSDVGLPVFETQANEQLTPFPATRIAALALSFRFMALPPHFAYLPDMDCESIRVAGRERRSPFAEPAGSNAPTHKPGRSKSTATQDNSFIRLMNGNNLAFLVTGTTGSGRNAAS